MHFSCGNRVLRTRVTVERVTAFGREGSGSAAEIAVLASLAPGAYGARLRLCYAKPQQRFQPRSPLAFGERVTVRDVPISSIVSGAFGAWVPLRGTALSGGAFGAWVPLRGTAPPLSLPGP